MKWNAGVTNFSVMSGTTVVGAAEIAIPAPQRVSISRIRTRPPLAWEFRSKRKLRRIFCWDRGFLILGIAAPAGPGFSIFF